MLSSAAPEICKPEVCKQDARKPEASSMSGEQQWKAHLRCRFQPGPGRTIVRREHVGPLTIQRPFYPEGDLAHVYILHPPGGIAAGDHLRVSIKAETNSAALVSTPGAARFYRSDSGIAAVKQDIECVGGSLEWLPQENIFFSGCEARLNTRITIENDTALAWWEINCFGRTRGDVPFAEGSVHNTVQIFSDSNLLLRDRLVVDSMHGLNMSCGLRSNTVAGTLVLTPLQSESLDIVRKLSGDIDGFSSTYFDGLLLVRYLGNCSESAKSGFIRIWSALRQSINNRPPHRPRIWAT